MEWTGFHKNSTNGIHKNPYNCPERSEGLGSLAWNSMMINPGIDSRSKLIIRLETQGRKSIEDEKSMADKTISLKGDYITLAQALKVAGLAGSGAEAKHFVRDGMVMVNGEAALQPGKKLRAGDQFQMGRSGLWTIVG